jgi:hypothetical protein
VPRSADGNCSLERGERRMRLRTRTVCRCAHSTRQAVSPHVKCQAHARRSSRDQNGRWHLVTPWCRHLFSADLSYILSCCSIDMH